MHRAGIRSKKTGVYVSPPPSLASNGSSPPPDRSLPNTPSSGSVEMSLGRRPLQKAQRQVAELDRPGRLRQFGQEGQGQPGLPGGQVGNASTPAQGAPDPSAASRPTTDNGDTRHMGYGTTNLTRGHAYAVAGQGWDRHRPPDSRAWSGGPGRAIDQATTTPSTTGDHLCYQYGDQLEVSSGSSSGGGSDDDRNRRSSRTSSRNHRSQ